LQNAEFFWYIDYELLGVRLLIQNWIWNAKFRNWNWIFRNPQSEIRNMKMSRFFLLFATGFGVGYSPIAPGTLGTLITIPIYSFLSTIPSPIYEITLIAFFFLSVWVSENAEIFFGKKDDPRIVIDEMMGFLITMLWLPKTIFSVITGFFLFRFFDILKPFPIRRLEKRLKGGWGVVLDDVMAGVYANIILHLIYLVTR
jgi:phosphatidylglycerophosphatase A